MVFTLIARITNNRETAEELTLDVFHDVWRRASTYDPDNPLPAPATSDPLETSDLKEQGHLLRQALTVLTPEERQVIETAFFSELTYDEVATRLNQPLGTVKTRVRSGLMKLRQALTKTVKEP
jgi:RNA polymerase sigma-70 factor (ECF subfamily)